MTVALRTTRDLERLPQFDRWIAIGGIDASRISLPAEQEMNGVSGLLEKAFTDIRTTWIRIGKQLSQHPGGRYSHAGACGSFGSDFGVMLAWGRIVGDCAKAPSRTLVVCDDPWLFRHAAELNGVLAGRPPSVISDTLKLTVRGFLSRLRVSLRCAWTAVGLRSARRAFPRGAASLLVYGHPASTTEGFDAYFGDLMTKLPELRRVLHVDCGLARAREMGKHNRTHSLHGWGNPLFALFVLPWTYWRPRASRELQNVRWLIRRSAVRENGGGGGAMSHWQMHCQRRWIKSARPTAVAWPWENFAWERDLVRATRQNRVRTIGYQHTVIGPHQFNYSIECNADGLYSVPDTIAANGPAYLTEMTQWGMPQERVVDAGAFRMKRPDRRQRYDPDGSVFMALSAVISTARRQLEVARKLAESGLEVLVKQHPMYPVPFSETDMLQRTEKPLTEHSKLSTVIYATGAMGLDARLLGLPSVRLRFPDAISIDVLPAHIENPVSDEFEILDFCLNPSQPELLDWDRLFSDVNYNKWRSLLTSVQNCSS